MDSIIGFNIKYLRRKKGLTQDQLAVKIGVKRSLIGSYEEGRAIPKLPTLNALASFFDMAVDTLLNTSLSDEVQLEKGKPDIAGNKLRVLSTVVDNENNEFITLVPVKATAGYLDSFADPEYVSSLPRFSLPFPELSKERSCRVFQIKGSSMEPVPPGSYIVCEYVQDWNDMKDGQTYIIVTHDDGIVYKRVYKNGDSLLLQSDNPQFAPYSIDVNTLREAWKALGYISFALPQPNELSLGKLSAMMHELQNEIHALKGEDNKMTP